MCDDLLISTLTRRFTRELGFSNSTSGVVYGSRAKRKVWAADAHVMNDKKFDLLKPTVKNPQAAYQQGLLSPVPAGEQGSAAATPGFAFLLKRMVLGHSDVLDLDHSVAYLTVKFGKHDESKDVSTMTDGNVKFHWNFCAPEVRDHHVLSKGFGPMKTQATALVKLV